MSADDKAAAAWDDYVSQQQEEKIEELERQLNAANSRIELLMSANADVARIAGERDAAEKRIRLLIAKLDKYQDSIKRLEEAGDALYENSDPTRWDSMQAANRKLDQQEEWRKAKEDKP